MPLNSMIVAPGETVTSLDQMSGKSVGVTGIPSDDAFYTTFLKTAGLTAGDVEKVNVGFNLVPSILSNKVDAIIGGYRNVEAIQIEQEPGRSRRSSPPTSWACRATPNWWSPRTRTGWRRTRRTPTP